MDFPKTAEQRRLTEARDPRSRWRHWGPYLADRAWGTVREDYSAVRDPWRYFPHDHARSRAYRWGEDGTGGVCNQFQDLCLAVAFWNKRDPFLKERLFGVANEEGNHHNVLRIAIELAQENPAYESVASKFYEHFVYISYALAHLGQGGHHEAGIWDEGDGFYYDVLHMPGGDVVPMKVRSKVGLTPIYAVEVIDGSMVERLPDFKQRVDWLRVRRPHLVANCSALSNPGDDRQLLFALPNRDQLVRVLRRVLDDRQFLSPFGARSLSRYHEAHPYTFYADGAPYSVGSEPGESRSNLFGGNSSWRGPIWFPTNHLLIESLRKYDRCHQTGWTALVAKLLDEIAGGENCACDDVTV